MSELFTGDGALVGRLLDGDDAAFEEFFGRYFPKLYRFAVTRLNNDANAAEDAWPRRV